MNNVHYIRTTEISASVFSLLSYFSIGVVSSFIYEKEKTLCPS